MFYSPLRYPGGKNRLSKLITQICIENNIDAHYVEPYAGGASVALYLLLEGRVKNITINDFDRSIYAFWRCVLTHTNKFCKLIEDTDITVENWRKQREIQRNKKTANILDLGFSTFFLNRTGYSGIINAGVIGGLKQDGNYKIDCRFNKELLIDRIRQRIKDTKINKNSHHKRTQPFNEIIKAPLVLSKITQDKVIEFWQQSENSKFDLVLPFNGLYSNCVFCFLKGKTKKLLLAHQLQNEQPDTPSSIKWWTDIEQTFSRKVIKSSNNQYTHIGFGGVAKKYMYQSIQEDIDNNDKTLDELIADAQRYNDNWTMACSCTD